MWVRVAFVIVLLILPTALHAQTEKRIALLIGNRAYDASVGVLKNPHNDIAVVGEALAKQGFEVLPPIKDARRGAILGGVRELARKLNTAGAGAIGFLYYSGHGAAEKDTNLNYLIPVDAREPGTTGFWDESLKLDDILKLLDGARSAAKFIVFDACRNELQLPTKDTTKGLVPVTEQQGMFIAYASAPGRTASDLGEKSGPYAAALASELGKPGLDHLNLFQNVKEAVLVSTGGAQQPWESNGLGRRIYLTGQPQTGTISPPQAATRLSEAAEAWDRSKDTTSIPVLELFLASYKDTYYAGLARLRIDELRKQQAAAAISPLASRPENPTAAQPAINVAPQAPSWGPSSPGKIRIGVAGPLTGPNAVFGVQLKNGAEQAAADLNEKGGINGQKIELVFGDDASNPKQGVSVANKMAGDGVKFVIGHFNSGVTMPASEVYQENGIYMITAASTNPRITERSLWNVFRTVGRDDHQGEVAGKYILSKFKGMKVAIIHDKTTYGQGLADATRKAMTKGGMKEVLYEAINIGEKDFSALVSKIKAAGADVVYWGGLHTEGGLIVRQMRDQGVKAVFMSGDGITSDEFASIGGPGVEGTLMTFGPDPRKIPAAADVVKKFAAKNINPEAYTLYSYAAMQVIAMAAADAKSLDPKKVAEATKKGRAFNTVIGDLAYNEKGDITRLDYVMYIWRKNPNGKMTYFRQ